VFDTQGLLISLEGIDGCGKTTQAGMLQSKLEQQGIPFISVREPGGTAVGEDIRNLLLQSSYSMTINAELLLYMAARAELAEQVILPALLDGKNVLCDRFTDSTLAYQGYGHGADLQWIRQLNHQASRGRQPDLTILFDLSVKEAVQRRGTKVDRMESNDFYYHQRVRKGYLELACSEPYRFFVIDGSLSVEKQGLIVWQFVRNYIDNRSETGTGDEF